MSTMRARLAAVLVGMLALVVVTGVAQHTERTSAAWTDPAVVVAQLNAGSWSTGPVNPGDGNTVMTGIEWTLVTNNPVQVCYVATVSTTSTTPVPWSLRMDLTQAPFNGATSGFGINDVNGGNISWKLGITYDTSAMTATIRGRTDVDSPIATITSAQTLRFSVCHYGLPPGVQTPSAYTVTYTNSPAWTSSRACVTATVTGNGSSRFYFGWTIELDMAAAYASLPNVTHWSNPTGNLSQVTQTDLGSRRFRFVSNSPANIAGTQTYQFTYCVNNG